MERDKLELFVEILNNSKTISFYLFNVKYIIYYENKKYMIKQESLSTYKIYPSIIDLFNNYYIYGESLKDLFYEIKIIY